MKPPNINYKQLIAQHLKILEGLKYDTGLFAASQKNVSTGYDKSWLRDNFYECLAFEIIKDYDTVEKTYLAILQIFLKHESKIDAAIMNKPKYKHEYIHARYDPKNFNEFWEDWGNKQNDAIGAILFKIGELEAVQKRKFIKTPDEVRILNKLVKYLSSIEYWQDPDSGMWENDEEVHASSVGACLAGLISIKRVDGVDVDDNLIEKGRQALDKILPRESEKKFVDLALLCLIYPYNIVTDKQKYEILTNVEYHLLREHGVVRYKNDFYYNRNPDGYSEEAEWTFGLSWLAIIYERMNNKIKATQFISKLVDLDTKAGMPELYFSNSDKFNENTPLGWAESLFIVALYQMNNKYLLD